MVGGMLTGFGLENGLAQQMAPGLAKNIVRGAGLFAEGQGDDIGSTIGTLISERGNRKTWEQRLQENKGVLLSMGGAAIVDAAVLPALFDASHNNMGLRLAAGGLFALTTYTGSLAEKIYNINRSRKTLIQLDKEGLLPG